MWRQLKIIDRRVIKNPDPNAFIFISNSDELINEDHKNTISRFSYVKHRAEQSRNPLLIIGQCLPIPNSFTLFEYTAMYPQLLGLYHKEPPMKKEVAIRNLRKKGMRISDTEPHQIGGIYVLGLEANWEISAQVVSDLLSTENGTINKKFSVPKSHIPLEYFYNQNRDMQRQRIAIESTYKLLYGQDVINKIVLDTDILMDYSLRTGQELVYVSDQEYKISAI